jgi:predicted transposase YbfD/YdcC
MSLASINPSPILTASFHHYFAAVPDPRLERSKQHPLIEILFLCVCAMLANADGPSDIACFGKEKLEWLRRFYPFANGIPSHDTIGRVLALVKPQAFQKCFLDWIGAFAPQSLSSAVLKKIGIDGKTLRGSGDGKGTLSPLHLVSAWSSVLGVSLGQVATDAKSNEITAIPILLKTLELKGAIVTIDAMGTQRAIATAIIDGGGDYILAVKRNQRNLYRTIEDYFVDAHERNFEGTGVQRAEAEGSAHGRKEERFYAVALLPESMQAFADKWDGLKAIGQAITTSETKGKLVSECRYFILSTGPKVDVFSDCVRSHWSIENTLHWSLDTTFHEDASQIHVGHGPENFGFLRRFALSLLQQDTSKGSLRVKRKKAGWSTEFLEKLLNLR